MTNLYQSDPRSLTDAELVTLSGELSEEYECSGYDDSYWTDDAAEERYHALRREISRREWVAAHPEDPEGKTRKPICPEWIAKGILEAFAREAEFFREMSKQAEMDHQFVCGDTITVRRPARFQFADGSIATHAEVD